MPEKIILTPENQQALARSLNMLDNSIQLLQQMASGMVPEALETLGLDEALRSFCDQVQQSWPVHIRYQSFREDSYVMAQDLAFSVYHIVQMLVQYAVTQKEPTRILVQCSSKAYEIRVTVEQDSDHLPAKLKNEAQLLQEVSDRVRNLGGNIDIRYVPAEETSVLIQLNG